MRVPSVAIGFLLLAAARAGAQAVARDSIITVTAQRTVHVTADRAAFYVVVEGVAETPTDAVTRVQSKLPAVTEPIRRAAPQARTERPVSYSVGATPNMNGYPGPTTPATQTARSVIRVELDRPDQASSVMAAAISAGASTTTGLTSAPWWTSPSLVARRSSPSRRTSSASTIASPSRRRRLS
jgi:uncharacterized protein YggE